jgi:hypothetical protein
MAGMRYGQGSGSGSGKYNTNSLPLEFVKGIGDYNQYESPYNPNEESNYNTTG